MISPQDQKKTGQGLETVIHSYAALMEKSKSIVDDPTLLPLPKEQMKEALVSAIKLTPAGQQREWLKTGYVMLAQFQSLTKEEKSAVTNWDSIMQMKDIQRLPKGVQESVIAEVTETGSLYTQVQSRISSEMQCLLDDLRRLGV